MTDIINPVQQSSGLKLILKVPPSSAGGLKSDAFSDNVGEESVSEMSPGMYSDASVSEMKMHKKSKKKKKKKHHHDKNEKKHHKEKKKKKHREKEKERYAQLNNESQTSASGVRNSRMNVEPTPLQRLLCYIHTVIQDKDKQKFFAWPVTDNIAPGYSNIISNPMDLSTMKHKIDRGFYSSLPEYVDDFTLMCRNAMVYNHPETVYFKAAKKLLHTGLKVTNPSKLSALQTALPYLNNIPAAQLGFSLGVQQEGPSNSYNCSATKQEFGDDYIMKNSMSEKENTLMEHKSDDSLTAEEILEKVREARDRCLPKKISNEMGYLRPSGDNAATLSILVPGKDASPTSKERPVLLGSLIGKLNSGSSSWQPFREDKRNLVKPVKPLNYGSFGSYAPSYDSAFANLTKEDSDLLFQTYGDDTSVQYAESVLNFAKDSDYTTVMVDNLLDIMTGGEHRKTKRMLDEKKRGSHSHIRELQEASSSSASTKKLKPTPTPVTSTVTPASTTSTTTSSAINSNNTTSCNEKSELSDLKSLPELGIDASFVDYYEDLWREEEHVKNKLNQTKNLIEKLHQVQNERLSLPPPSHLSQIPLPTTSESQLASKITEGLTQIIKKVSPCAVASVSGIRKALGLTLPPVTDPVTQPENQMSQESYRDKLMASDDCADDIQRVTTSNGAASCVSGLDLESELREFLENDTGLSNFDLTDDDRTIETMLANS